MVMDNRVGMNQKTWIPIVRKPELDKLFNIERKTIREVAKIYGCSCKVISNHLKKYEINKWGWHPNKEQLYDLYINKNMTQVEIKEYFKLKSAHIVETLMKRYSIPRRKTAKRNQFGQHNASWNGGIRILNGYRYVYDLNSRCNKHYAPEHDLVMEKYLGRKLKYYSLNNRNNEVVHHIDGNKLNNSLDNLKLMTHGEHVRFHRLQNQPSKNLNNSDT